MNKNTFDILNFQNLINLFIIFEKKKQRNVSQFSSVTKKKFSIFKNTKNASAFYV